VVHEPASEEPADGIFLIRGFADGAECDALIRRSEQAGYEAATLATARGAKLDTSVRNNARLIEDDFGRAADLWVRLRDHIPAFLGGHQAIGVNERFRFYRYDPGERFSGHIDAPFRRDNGEHSLLTFMIYLNGGFAGGETAFRETTFRPEAGAALLFRHDLFHEGRPVTEGRKYVLRSDVMFNPPGRLTSVS
jgi:predicted 2-oxoglutarate/Fe(II)-dependent dioxygenase YbiX